LRRNGEKIEKKWRKNRESAIVRRLEFLSARSKRLQPLDLSFNIEKSHFAHTTLPSRIIIGPLKRSTTNFFCPRRAELAKPAILSLSPFPLYFFSIFSQFPLFPPSRIIIGPLKLARPPTRLARKRSGVRRVSRVCGRIAALVFYI
jgi:hypothetical protein